MKNLIYAFLLLEPLVSIGQNKPTSYVDSTGNLYWRKSTPVYLYVSDNPDGGEHRLKSKATAKYADPFYLDTEGVNYLRSRNAVDPETKRAIPDTEVMFEIYADGIAPASSIAYENVSMYKRPEALYYKAGLTVSLSSKDALSGIRNLQYSINGAPFVSYEKPIDFSKQGQYDVEVFAEDNVGNVEEPIKISFIIDDEKPSTNLTVNGITEDKVISSGSKMYLTAYDSLSGIKSVNYKFDDGALKSYNGGEVAFSSLEEGEHTIEFYAVDQVSNVQEKESFSFFYDKSAPLMVADVLGDRFVVEGQVYFSGRTKLKLTAVDNKVGVKAIKYSIDSDEFLDYEAPFYLPSVSGTHMIRYYSIDNLNNSTADKTKSKYLGGGGFEEFKHNVSKVYVDLNGPIVNHNILNYSFLREDTLYIGPHSKIRLTGTDAESGIKQLSYSVNSQVGETEYDAPFSLDKEGYTVVNYYGYDNVNNRNVSNLKFYLDATSPEIFVQFNTGSTRERNGLKEYPETTGIFLSATDITSGIGNLYYTLDKDPEKKYAGLISNLSKGKHSLKVRAVDLLNNESIQEIDFYVK